MARAAVTLATLGIAHAACAQIAAGPQAADAAAAFGLRVHDGSGRRGLMVEGAPKLADGVVPPRGTLISVEVRFGAAARLQQSLWSNNAGLEAGTLLFGTTFQATAEAAEPVAGWCGPGHAGLLRLPFTVCLLESPDGKARLVNGVYSLLGEDYRGPVPRSYIHGAPPWYVGALEPLGRPPPIERPPLAPADAADLPLLRMSLVYLGQDKSGVLRFVTRVGLASETQSPVPIRSYGIKLEDGVARRPFGAFDLVLTQTGEGVSGQWEPSARAPVPPVPAPPVPVPPASAPTERDAGRPDAPVATLTTPAPSPRPKPTPFVIRGARLDPTELNASTGPVEAGGTLLSGPAAHWRTAHADVDAVAFGLHVRTGKDGVFHEVEVVDDALGARAISHAWCGQVSSLGLPTTRCVRVRAGGSLEDELYFTPGADWMSGVGTVQPVTIRLLKAALTPAAQDLVGPMTFSLRLDGAGRRLALHAQVERNGAAVTIWRGELEFDATDTARLPLWSRTLVVHRTKPGVVEARLDPHGDGRGPLELPSPASR